MLLPPRSPWTASKDRAAADTRGDHPINHLVAERTPFEGIRLGARAHVPNPLIRSKEVLAVSRSRLATLAAQSAPLLAGVKLARPPRRSTLTPAAGTAPRSSQAKASTRPINRDPLAQGSHYR
jgi:hypothetical protein